MIQLEFDFSDVTKITLVDKDGDQFVFERYADKVRTVRSFLGCTKKKAAEVLGALEKDWDVYADGSEQIVLCRGNQIVYNFEMYGETYWHGHKYNELNRWAFKRFIDGKKPQKKNTRPKEITVVCTEIQRKKAMQLYYAWQIGFDVTYKDYQRWYLLGAVE